MSALKLKDKAVIANVSDLTAEQKKLLGMIEHGGLSRFIAMVNAGTISEEDATRVAAAYGKIRSANSQSSMLKRFARLVLG